MSLRAVLLATASVLALTGAGCARPRAVPSSPLDDVSQEEWTIARARLLALRERQPKRPYVERVAVAMIDPRTGKRYQSRGAVAVSPDHAARMILLGPGGTTAVDVWVTRDRFRFSVPGLKYERRGGADPEEARGLPVGLLRWWFLAPLSGRLLVARSTAKESSWLLRDGDATVLVRSDGRRFLAVRTQEGHDEGLEWLAPRSEGEAGAQGRYVDGRNGLRVEVLVEGVSAEEPDPDAFADPDGETPPSTGAGGASL